MPSAGVLVSCREPPFYDDRGTCSGLGTNQIGSAASRVSGICISIVHGYEFQNIWVVGEELDLCWEVLIRQ